MLDANRIPTSYGVAREMIRTAHQTAMSSARLKLELLASGVRIGPGVEDFLATNGKPPLRVRSGSCGGLDLILPGGIYVNCPVDELFAVESRFVLHRSAEVVKLVDEHTATSTEISVLPCPDYYARATRAGTPLRQIGQLCSDRLGIGLTNGCTFWAKPATRCTFCSIGLNVRTGHEIGQKRVDDVIQVAEAALDDPVMPATHILLGGGTPVGPDAGALAMAEVTRKLKARWPKVPIYVMIAPPSEGHYVSELIEAGVDELGINLEVWSNQAGERYLPGKWRLGRSHFLAMLAVAVAAYAGRIDHADSSGWAGVGRVRSIMIVGLEPAEETLRGVEALASRGVMPILTPFRPMRGTVMERHPRWDGAALWDMALAATDLAAEHGLPLGPTCVPCQANTLNIPGNPAYRAY